MGRSEKEEEDDFEEEEEEEKRFSSGGRKEGKEEEAAEWVSKLSEKEKFWLKLWQIKWKTMAS